MFTQLTVTVYLALIAAATPLVVRKNPVTVPLARRLNITSGTKLADIDRARAKAFKTGSRSFQKPSKDAVTPVSVNNTAVTYTATVRISCSRAGILV